MVQQTGTESYGRDHTASWLCAIDMTITNFHELETIEEFAAIGLPYNYWLFDLKIGFPVRRKSIKHEVSLAQKSRDTKDAIIDGDP